jgi:GH15 family glucan-1,4-alpha-glucosidase
MGFDEPGSPRVRGTVAAIREELTAGGPLMYRYLSTGDDHAESEGAFVACSFWLVEALARLGRKEEAAQVFEDLCARSNDVGLFAEQIDPRTGEHLGNFPQALSHAGLLQAALAIHEPERAHLGS